MQQIVIFGAGKVADVIYRHIAFSGAYDVAGFTTDGAHVPASGTFHGKPVVAFDEIEKHFPPDRYGMIVALGYHDLNRLRRERYDAAKEKGYAMVSFISPRASIGDWLEMGDNCIVLDNAVIEPGSRLGNNVVVWSGVLIGHHTSIEDHAWIAGQAIFGGSARLGAGSFVGLGAIVGHEVDLGEDTMVGAGSLVTKCADPKAVFIERNTELFRLDSDRFLKISKLR
jgi:sugar O-acyltransferase (sialic acid O-acetyltransferase NeuD family)